MAQPSEGQAIDDAIVSINWTGRYYVGQMMIMLISIFPLCFHILSVVFIGKHIDYRCAPLTNATDLIHDYVYNLSGTNNITVEYNQCDIQILNNSHVIHQLECISGFEYDGSKTGSFVSEWDLLCDRASLSGMTQTVVSVGMTVGSFVFPVLADRYGRRPLHLVAHVCLLATGIALAFSPSLLTFTVLRFFIGVFQQGSGLTTSILMLEILPTNKRYMTALAGSMFWTGGVLLLALIGYLAQDLSWRTLEIILALFSIIVVVEIWKLDESVRWLVANNKMDQAEAVIKRAAKENKKDATTAIRLLRESKLSTLDACNDHLQQDSDKSDDYNDDQRISSQKKVAEKQTSIWSYISNKYILMTLSITCLMWFTDSMVYYGLFFASGSLNDDLYLGFLVSGIAEIPVCMVMWAVINRVGRKRSNQLFHVLAGLSLLIASVFNTAHFAASIPGREIFVIVFGLIGKFSISLTYSIIFIYTPELFPTNLRNAALGISSMSSRFSLMIAPYALTFAQYVPWGPSAVFAALCIVVAVLTQFLPETRSLELLQTVEDFDKLFTGDKNSIPKKNGKESSMRARNKVI